MLNIIYVYSIYFEIKPLENSYIILKLICPPAHPIPPPPPPIPPPPHPPPHPPPPHPPTPPPIPVPIWVLNTILSVDHSYVIALDGAASSLCTTLTNKLNVFLKISVVIKEFGRRVAKHTPFIRMFDLIKWDLDTPRGFLARRMSYIRRHDDVMTWNFSAMMTSSNGNIFPRYWPFVRGIHRSPVTSPHKGPWRGALMFTLICARINGWVNNREAGDLRRQRDHYEVSVMITGGRKILTKWR